MQYSLHLELSALFSYENEGFPRKNSSKYSILISSDVFPGSLKLGEYHAYSPDRILLQKYILWNFLLVKWKIEQCICEITVDKYNVQLFISELYQKKLIEKFL